MLKERIITALVLLAVLVGCLMAAEPWPFSALTLLLMTAAGWEWARLNKAGPVAMSLTVLGVVGGCLLLALQWHMPLWTWAMHAHQHALEHTALHVHLAGEALAGFMVPAKGWWVALVVWVLGAVLMLRRGLTHWSQWPATLRLVLGSVLLVAAWLAMMEAKHQGLNLLLSIMSLVWVADIGAYFAGRALGKRKLAPSISPGKSWEGAVAGAVATQLLAFGWCYVDQQVAVDSPSLYSHLLAGLGMGGMCLAVVFLTTMSVVGDLVESLVKRVAQVKDSSQLLPGHGGVLDRIDALLPVLPLSMALLSLCHA